MNRLAGMLTYLVGPMEQEVNRGADWRLEITSFLQKRLKVGVLNPCDKPLEADNEAHESANTYQRINALKKLGVQAEQNGFPDIALAYYKQAGSLAKPFVRMDLRSVDISHFLIMNVNPDVHACGSYGEQAMSTLQRKPIITYCPKGKDRIPNWLYGILKPEMFFTTIDEVKNYLLHIAHDNEVDDLNRWRFIDMNKVYGRELF